MLSQEGYEHRCRKPTCGHVERADDSSNRRCPKDGRVLLLRGGAEEEIRRQFPGGARVYWHLHPPFLRALGMKRKLRLGRWARPALSLLRALRRLRGTAVDPFGPSEVRRVERALIEEYRAMVLRALEMPSLHDAAVAIAELPIWCAATSPSSCATCSAFTSGRPRSAVRHGRATRPSLRADRNSWHLG